MEYSLLKVDAENAVVSAVVPNEDGSILVRVYETAGKDGQAVITFKQEVANAEAVNLAGEVLEGKVQIKGEQVILSVEAYSIAAVKVNLQ